MKEKEEKKSHGTNGTNTGQTRTREKKGEKTVLSNQTDGSTPSRTGDLG
jgi:hypothetical protein